MAAPAQQLTARHVPYPAACRASEPTRSSLSAAALEPRTSRPCCAASPPAGRAADPSPPGAAPLLDGGDRSEVAAPVQWLVDPHWTNAAPSCLTRPFALGSLSSRGAQFGTPGRTSLQRARCLHPGVPGHPPVARCHHSSASPRPGGARPPSGRVRLRPGVLRLHFGRQACPDALYRDPGPAPFSRRALLHLRRSATIRTRPASTLGGCLHSGRAVSSSGVGCIQNWIAGSWPPLSG